MDSRTALLLLAACASESPCPLEEASEPVDQPNVLVVMIDDTGIDQYAAWGAALAPPSTPTMDCLCAEGLRFDTVWASPYCTPARAALLTGQHPRREGIGRFVNQDTSEWELPLARRTLAEALAEQGYANAFFGKWHLGSKVAPTRTFHPNAQGFEHFSGTLGNLRTRDESSRRGKYFTWEHLTNGVLYDRSGYLTSETVDDAVAGIADLAEPWFVVVSFNGAHVPLHRPPRRLRDERLSRDASEADQYRAMVTAVDAEIGRLLRSIDAEVRGRTQVWSMSDNGSIAAGIPPELDADRAKGTLFEGGVRVPMVVAGASVPQRGAASDALVSILDVFPTVVELAGGDPGPTDGRSLLPLLEDPSLDHHPFLYADVSSRDGDVSRAVRSHDRKLVRRSNGQLETWALGPGLEETKADVDSVDLRVALDGFIEAYERPRLPLDQ